MKIFCGLLIIATGLNWFIPDPLPYVDEIVMTIFSVMCARKHFFSGGKKKAPEGK